MCPLTFDPDQVQEARNLQHSAATDDSDQVHVIAGPGTGKTATIEQRVCELIRSGVTADGIRIVSFTRAATRDLHRRMARAAEDHDLPAAREVHVSTLHSLALRTLRAAGRLEDYPVDPLVLDDWELENIFDAEFRRVVPSAGKVRARDIRRIHEAYWSTERWDPPNYIPPHPPITADEISAFQAFHSPRTQMYSCVLPGEIIRTCVAHIRAGTLNPVDLLRIQHLVVDEYQDLNPIDIEFVDSISGFGASTFILGDDDQSLYSFRFAHPKGIQEYPTKFPTCGQHQLVHCFRCPPEVLSAATQLVETHSGDNRIGKELVSLHETADPPHNGTVIRWRFVSDIAEATALAAVCSGLIDRGVAPRQIFILVPSIRSFGNRWQEPFSEKGVPLEIGGAASFLDIESNRFVHALARVVCNTDDYVAHRILLGLRRGTGIATCHRIAAAAHTNNLNYRALFYDALPSGVFSNPQLTAINAVRDICSIVSGWEIESAVSDCQDTVYDLLQSYLGTEHAEAWNSYFGTLPTGINWKELRDLFWANSDDQIESVLAQIRDRTGATEPSESEELLLPQRVRLMTMHASKGLDAAVVIIPGLKEGILPDNNKRRFPGLVSEAARMLYVAITRARATCFVSFSTTRIVQGAFANQTPSRFVANLNGTFESGTSALSDEKLDEIASNALNV